MRELKIPDREDYDFNDPFESLRFVNDLLKYIDQIEAQNKGLVDRVKEIESLLEIERGHKAESNF